MSRLTARLTRLETCLQTERSPTSLLIFHLPEDTPEAACARWDIEPADWVTVRFRPWLWSDWRPCPGPVVLGTPPPPDFAARLRAKHAELAAMRHQHSTRA
jgi:hypothetical protein